MTVHSHPWPMYGYNSQHTRCSHLPGPMEGVLRELLRSDDPHSYPPVIASDGTIYYVSYDETSASASLYSLFPNEYIRWNAYPAGTEPLPPFIANQKGTAYSRNPHAWWRFSRSGPKACSAPVIGLDGAIYWGGPDGVLYSLNPTGSLRWKIPFRDAIRFLVLGREGNLLFCISDTLLSVDSQGRSTWCVNKPSIDRTGNKVKSIQSGPTLGGYGLELIILIRESELVAYKEDGTIKWAMSFLGGEKDHWPHISWTSITSIGRSLFFIGNDPCSQSEACSLIYRVSCSGRVEESTFRGGMEHGHYLPLATAREAGIYVVSYEFWKSHVSLNSSYDAMGSSNVWSQEISGYAIDLAVDANNFLYLLCVDIKANTQCLYVLNSSGTVLVSQPLIASKALESLVIGPDRTLFFTSGGSLFRYSA